MMCKILVGEGRFWVDQALCVTMSTDHADCQGHKHSVRKVGNELLGDKIHLKTRMNHVSEGDSV